MTFEENCIQKIWDAISQGEEENPTNWLPKSQWLFWGNSISSFPLFKKKWYSGCFFPQFWGFGNIDLPKEAVSTWLHTEMWACAGGREANCCNGQQSENVETPAEPATNVAYTKRKKMGDNGGEGRPTANVQGAYARTWPLLPPPPPLGTRHFLTDAQTLPKTSQTLNPPAQI